MGVILLTTHGAVFLVVLFGAAAPWVWAVLLVRMAGMWEVQRRYFMTRFRQLDGRERHTLDYLLGIPGGRGGVGRRLWPAQPVGRRHGRCFTLIRP